MCVSIKIVLPCKRSIAQFLSIISTTSRGFSQLGSLDFFFFVLLYCVNVFFNFVLFGCKLVENFCVLVLQISFTVVHTSNSRISRKLYMVSEQGTL